MRKYNARLANEEEADVRKGGLGAMGSELVH